MHPLEAGIFRLKFRRDRRLALRRESSLLFYPRYVGETLVKALGSAEAVQIVVVGAHNAGVSAVIETFGPRGGPPAIAPVESAPA